MITLFLKTNYELKTKCKKYNIYIYIYIFKNKIFLRVIISARDVETV